jgi:class 3 adenylate cyclase
MPELHTDTLAFLFTDIEGSTSLWERRPEAMREALARHDGLRREAIEKHGGQAFELTLRAGDAPQATAGRDPKERSR